MFFKLACTTLTFYIGMALILQVVRFCSFERKAQ